MLIYFDKWYMIYLVVQNNFFRKILLARRHFVHVSPSLCSLMSCLHLLCQLLISSSNAKKLIQEAMWISFVSSSLTMHQRYMMSETWPNISLLLSRCWSEEELVKMSIFPWVSSRWLSEQRHQEESWHEESGAGWNYLTAIYLTGWPCVRESTLQLHFALQHHVLGI